MYMNTRQRLKAPRGGSGEGLCIDHFKITLSVLFFEVCVLINTSELQ